MGYLKPLPREYIGEKHVVTLDRHPDASTSGKNGPDLDPPPGGGR